MTRSWLTATVCFLPVLLVGCIGIEHEDIGGSGGTGTATTTGGDGDGETGGDGDGDGEEEGTDSSGFGPKFDAAGDGDGDGDGDHNVVPRLFVSGSAVAMWDADDIQDDEVRDGALPTGAALALALGDDRLFVARTDAQEPLQFFANPGGLGDNAAADGGVGITPGFGDVALTGVAEMHVDAGDNLWMVDDGVRLFEAASTLVNGSAFDARFVDDVAGFSSAAHDATGLKLLGAHGTNGVAFWNAPLAAMNTNQPTDYLAASFEARRTVVAGDDLYVASGDAPYLRVWRSIDLIAAPAAPDVTLGAAVTGLASPVHVYVRGTILVVTDDSDGGRVLIWDDATSLAADQAPDHVVGDAELAAPTQAILGQDDRLYVRDGTGFRVYTDALGAGTLAATVDADLGTTTDMVLLECRVDGDCTAMGATCTNGTCG